MRRLVFLLFAAFILFGCDSNSTLPPVTVDLLPIEISPKSTEKTGMKYTNATFSNQSDYIVNSFLLDAKSEEVDEPIHFYWFDTVLPQEISPRTNCLKDLDPAQIKYTQLEYQISKDGIIYQITYDFSKEKYEVKSFEDLPDFTPEVTYDQLPYQIDAVIAEEDSPQSWPTVFTNNSDQIIVEYRIGMLLKDVNEIHYYYTGYTVFPGETSPSFWGRAPLTGSLEDMEPVTLMYIWKDEDGEQSVEFNYKTQKYSEGY